MTQADLNRSVARATGETVCTIRRLGFLLAGPDGPFPDRDQEQRGPSVPDRGSLDRTPSIRSSCKHSCPRAS